MAGLGAAFFLISFISIIGLGVNNSQINKCMKTGTAEVKGIEIHCTKTERQLKKEELEKQIRDLK